MKEIVLKNENDVVDNLAESYLLRIHEDVYDTAIALGR